MNRAGISLTTNGEDACSDDEEEKEDDDDATAAFVRGAGKVASRDRAIYAMQG